MLVFAGVAPPRPPNRDELLVCALLNGSRPADTSLVVAMVDDEPLVVLPVVVGPLAEGILADVIDDVAALRLLDDHDAVECFRLTGAEAKVAVRLLAEADDEDAKLSGRRALLSRLDKVRFNLFFFSRLYWC